MVNNVGAIENASVKVPEPPVVNVDVRKVILKN